MPPIVRYRILDRGRHGGQPRGREGQARTYCVTGTIAIELLRLSILRIDDIRANRDGHIRLVVAVPRPARTCAVVGDVARLHRAVDTFPRRTQGRDRAVHGRSVSRDLAHGVLPCGMAADGIRIPVQRPSGGKCGMEAIPKDGIGIHVESAQFTIDRRVRITLARDHGVQEIFHTLELEDDIRTYDGIERYILVVAGIANQGQNLRT